MEQDWLNLPRSKTMGNRDNDCDIQGNVINMRYLRRLACCFLWATLLPLMAQGAVIDRDTTVVVSAPTVRMVSGETANLSIQMENNEDTEYNGYQFDIQLPQGVTIAKNDSDFIYSLSKRYDEKAKVRIQDYEDGCYRFMVFSFSDSIITGTEGELISLTLQADSTMETGTYQGTVFNFKLSSKIGITFMGTDAAFDILLQDHDTFLLGDVNHDGIIDISDVMMTVNYSVGKKLLDFYIEEAETNGDGEIDIVDVMNILNIVVRKH